MFAFAGSGRVDFDPRIGMLDPRLLRLSGGFLTEPLARRSGSFSDLAFLQNLNGALAYREELRAFHWAAVNVR